MANIYEHDIIHAGITHGRVSGALCTKISEVNLPAFIYKLFHEDFSSIVETNTFVANLAPYSGIYLLQTQINLKSPVAQCVARGAPMQQCVWWLVRAQSSS